MDYRVHLSQFDGPLDLLLHLIEKAEVDIKDIFVSEITSMFLEYLKELDELDMDQASEFLSVAATLLYIKSRSLFPPAPKPDAEDEDDPGELLVMQLREYKAFKQASVMMRTLKQEAGTMHTKPPEEFSLPPKEIILRDTNVRRLFDAMLAAIGRKEIEKSNKAAHEVIADKYTIRSCAHNVREVLKLGNGVTTFEYLIKNAGKMELIATFMALLEMTTGGEIRLEQKEYCGCVTIIALKLLKSDSKINYMDEVD